MTRIKKERKAIGHGDIINAVCTRLHLHLHLVLPICSWAILDVPSCRGGFLFFVFMFAFFVSHEHLQCACRLLRDEAITCFSFPHLPSLYHSSSESYIITSQHAEYESQLTNKDGWRGQGRQICLSSIVRNTFEP